MELFHIHQAVFDAQTFIQNVKKRLTFFFEKNFENPTLVFTNCVMAVSSGLSGLFCLFPDKKTENITCCSPVFAIMATPLKIKSQPNQIKSNPNQVTIYAISIRSLVLQKAFLPPFLDSSLKSILDQMLLGTIDSRVRQFLEGRHTRI